MAAWHESAEAQHALSTPPCRRGAYAMFGVLAAFMAAVALQRGPVEAVVFLGIRRPALALFTLALLSPAVLELAYPRWALKAKGRTRMVLDRLHLAAPYLMAIGTMMVLMRFENSFDMEATAALATDFTPWVYRLEGDLVQAAQDLLRGAPGQEYAWTPATDLFLMFVYLTVFAVYHLAGILGFALAGRLEMVRRFTVTWVGIYAAALPFYLLFPVNEVWTTAVPGGAFGGGLPDYGYGHVQNVLGDGAKVGQGASLAIASINNCFPSLHNAFAWALPFLLWRSGYRTAGNRVAVVAFLISLSTIHLGIHWVTDLVAGIALAWLVTGVAMRLDYHLGHRLELRVAWRRGAPGAA